MNTGMLVFSIINIVLGCCCGPMFIFGIAALIFTVIAKSATTDKTAENYNKVALILNIVGVVLSIVVVIAAFALGFVEAYSESFYYSLIFRR